MLVNVISTMFNVRYYILMICIDILKPKSVINYNENVGYTKSLCCVINYHIQCW